ncbi:MAG TPA: hypothetical protein VKU00_14595 [Chthonomonadaceae bacterium]|nr:hypothetical protein [Chthonomonadaceae bacterium]
MNYLKVFSALMGLLVIGTCLPGCDSEGKAPVSEGSDSSDTDDMGPMKAEELPVNPNTMTHEEIPAYTETFSVSDPKRSSTTDIVETTVVCDPARKVPITISLETFQTIKKSARWIFHIENTDTVAWEGAVRVYLVVKGKVVDHVDYSPKQPMQPGEGIRVALDSTHMPQMLKGDIDRYGWTYYTTRSHSVSPSPSTLSHP